MKLVISAVNFTEGGPLTVLREIVRAAATHFPQWTVYVLVHAVGTVHEPGVIEIAFPASKRSWLRRLQLEWFKFKKVSEDLRPDVWLSLHDITPRVQARRQYVYCHNPAPFCTQAIQGERHDRTFRLFRRYYGYLYRVFVHRNRAVIVQQEWLRRMFSDRFGVDRVIVAHPEVQVCRGSPRTLRVSTPPSVFLYPAFPRVFKNFEVLGNACILLERDPRWAGQLWLTIDGSEGSYSAAMKAQFADCRSIRFLGLQPPGQLLALYDQCDALVFASLLETWGLPITEAKGHELPILAADLPYARETVGNYDRACFFDPTDAQALAALMLRLHLGELSFKPTQRNAPEQPFADGWVELLRIMLVDDEAAISRRPAGTNG